jgi:hypothetical protein
LFVKLFGRDPAADEPVPDPAFRIGYDDRDYLTCYFVVKNKSKFRVVVSNLSLSKTGRVKFFDLTETEMSFLEPQLVRGDDKKVMVTIPCLEGRQAELILDEHGIPTFVMKWMGGSDYVLQQASCHMDTTTKPAIVDYISMFGQLLATGDLVVERANRYMRPMPCPPVDFFLGE